MLIKKTNKKQQQRRSNLLFFLSLHRHQILPFQQWRRRRRRSSSSFTLMRSSSSSKTIINIAVVYASRCCHRHQICLFILPLCERIRIRSRRRKCWRGKTEEEWENNLPFICPNTSPVLLCLIVVSHKALSEYTTKELLEIFAWYLAYRYRLLYHFL